MKKTEVYSYFTVESAGDHHDALGFIPADNSDFDPAELTKLLGIKPFRARKLGEPRRNGHGLYPASVWSGCRQESPSLDGAEQCARIAEKLRPLAPQLKEFKKRYAVDYTLIVVPRLANAVVPVLHFDRAVVRFCAEIGAEIGVDLRFEDDI